MHHPYAVPQCDVWPARHGRPVDRFGHPKHSPAHPASGADRRRDYQSGRQGQGSAEIYRPTLPAPLLCFVVHQPKERGWAGVATQAGAGTTRARDAGDDDGHLRTSVPARRRARGDRCINGAQRAKKAPGAEAGAFQGDIHEDTSRDQGALDAPILSQSTNQARRIATSAPMISLRPSYRLDNRHCPRRTKDSGEQ
jgi:hypothetical protein